MKLLDSTFLIDIIRKKDDALSKLAELGHEKVYTTRINAFEILVGAFSIKSEKDTNIRLAEILTIFQNLFVLELDEKSTLKAAQISGKLNREGIRIEPSDCLIAGIALSNGISAILTKNTKDFERIEGIKVESY